LARTYEGFDSTKSAITLMTQILWSIHHEDTVSCRCLLFYQNG